MSIHNNPIAVGNMPVQVSEQSLYIPSTPHGQIVDLTIKGDNQMNYLGFHNAPYIKATKFATFGGQVSTSGKNGLTFIYDNKCTDIANPGNNYSLQITNELAHLFEKRVDYTINIRVKAISPGFKRRVNLYMYDSITTNSTFPVRDWDVGYYCHTFQIRNYQDDKLNSLLGMQYRSSEPFNKDEHEYAEIEFLNLVKGTNVFLPYTIGETGAVENLKIYTQEERPILGEYQMGGDIPQVFNHMESGLVLLENAFKTTWR